MPGRTTVAEYNDVLTALARDDDAGAAEALRAAVAIGDVQNWWVFRAPVFASALDGPEFPKALAELEAEIARQRADYDAQPDLPPI